MDGKLIEAQDIFLGGVNQLCNKFGLNNIMAQLYAILYLSDAPLSLHDMVERLKISKGSVSVNIRALERYGVVKRVWVKGSRRDYYEAETDISKVIIDRIKAMGQARLAEIENVIKSSYSIIEEQNVSNKEDEKAVDFFKERLEKLRDIQHKAQSIFELLNSSLANTLLRNK